MYCKFGGRAKMGMSVLLRNGFTNLVVTEEGGYQTLLDTNKLPKWKIYITNIKIW